MTRRAGLGLAVDVLLVAVFVLIGRRTHDGDSVLAGFLVTLWPFAAALLLGWLLARAWRTPDRLIPSGLIVWVVTVAGGMALRVLSGQGVQLSFVVVRTIVLGVFLLGRRALTRLIGRRR